MVVEEPAELLDGTPVIVDGMSALDVGDRAVWFLVAGDSDELPYLAAVNGQGRYEIAGATLRPSGEDRLSQELAALGVEGLVAAVDELAPG